MNHFISPLKKLILNYFNFIILLIIFIFPTFSINASDKLQKIAIKEFQKIDKEYGFNKNPQKETTTLETAFVQRDNGTTKLILVMIHDLYVGKNGIDNYLYLNFALLLKSKKGWKVKSMYLDSIPCNSFKRKCNYKVLKMASGKPVIMSDSQIEYLGGMEGFLNVVGVIGNEFKKLLKVKVHDKDRHGNHSGESNLRELQFNEFTSKYKFIKNPKKDYDDIKILTIGKKPVVGDNISENSKLAHERARDFRSLRYYTILHGRYEIVQNKTRYQKPSKIEDEDYQNSVYDKLFQVHLQQGGNYYIIEGDSKVVELKRKPFTLIIKTRHPEEMRIYCSKSIVDERMGRGFKYMTHFLNDYINLDKLLPFDPRNRINLNDPAKNYLIMSTEGHDRWIYKDDKNSSYQSVSKEGDLYIAKKNIEKFHFTDKDIDPKNTEKLEEVTANKPGDTRYEMVFWMFVKGKGKQFKAINIKFMETEQERIEREKKEKELKEAREKLLEKEKKLEKEILEQGKSV
ncbi:MAG: hypothetical protein KDK36_16340, partial [Leptospiraceae bacterium]|nr:hypothetical protein [Leptospiraceae bacterium]